MILHEGVHTKLYPGSGCNKKNTTETGIAGSSKQGSANSEFSEEGSPGKIRAAHKPFIAVNHFSFAQFWYGEGQNC